MAEVLVGSNHIDQSRIVGRIDFVVLRRKMVYEGKAKEERKQTSTELPARHRPKRLQSETDV